MRASASIRRLKTRARFTLSAGALLGGRGLFFEEQRNTGEKEAGRGKGTEGTADFLNKREVAGPI